MKKSNTWLFISLILVFCQCSTIQKSREVSIDLPQIQKNGFITVLTENTSLSYFEYRGKKLGFDYEILDAFAKSLNLNLKVKVVSNSKNFIKYLRKGEGDIIAANKVITLGNKEEMAFSLPYYWSHQVLVQRSNLDSLLIKTPVDLGEETLYIRKESAFEDRMEHLSDEIGTRINCKYYKNDPCTEDLIELVANNKIKYTIAHENLARISKELHPQLHIKTVVSNEQKMGFAMRFKSPLLQKALNKFLQKFIVSSEYKELKKKYFDYVRPPENEKFEIPPIKNGCVSPFDDLFKAAASKYGWDWRLLAAVSFKESRFNPNARGQGGAYGMMQFMPNTGPSYGVYPNSPPEVQINGGMKMLHKTYLFWSSIPDESQRIKFTLASYNAGKSHITDAQKLAIKHGLNPKVWDGNVQEMVKKLADPNYYRDPVVTCGAYRGPASRYANVVYQTYLSWKGNE